MLDRVARLHLAIVVLMGAGGSSMTIVEHTITARDGATLSLRGPAREPDAGQPIMLCLHGRPRF